MKEISFTSKEAEIIIDIIEYYIEEVGLPSLPLKLEEVDPKLFKIVVKLNRYFAPKTEFD